MMLSCKVSLYAYRRLPYQFPPLGRIPRKKKREGFLLLLPLRWKGEKKQRRVLYMTRQKNEGTKELLSKTWTMYAGREDKKSEDSYSSQVVFC